MMQSVCAVVQAAAVPVNLCGEPMPVAWLPAGSSRQQGQQAQPEGGGQVSVREEQHWQRHEWDFGAVGHSQRTWLADAKWTEYDLASCTRAGQYSSGRLILGNTVFIRLRINKV